MERKAKGTPEELNAYKEALQTSGRPGLKAARINLAITPTNHEYVRIMSKITGYTMTEFINLCIEKYREENSEIFDKALELQEAIQKSGIKGTFFNKEPIKNEGANE